MSDYTQNWRISRSGFSIRTGWGDSKEMIAIYPYKAHPLDGDKFNEWLANAEQICKHHNQADIIESQAAEIERLKTLLFLGHQELKSLRQPGRGNARVLIESQAAKIEQLKALISGLECDSEWCGKSPCGTPGKRGYNDGRCQVCKARSALKETTE